MHFLRMKGREVYKFAVPYLLVEILREFVFAHGLEEMDRFVHDGARPFIRHQALVLFRLQQKIHFSSWRIGSRSEP
jgi:hypothetical protein